MALGIDLSGLRQGVTDQLRQVRGGLDGTPVDQPEWQAFTNYVQQSNPANQWQAFNGGTSNPAAQWSTFLGVTPTWDDPSVYLRNAQAIDQQKANAKPAGSMIAEGNPGSGGGYANDPELAPYKDYIAKAAAEFGVPADRLAAIIKLESHGNANAVSSAGALGLGQVMPENFGPGEDPNDPLTNIRVSARVLKQKYDANGQDWNMATRAYHGFGSDGYSTDQDYLAQVQKYQASFGAALGSQGATQAVQRAQSLLGTPYQLGGWRAHPDNPSAGIDCSELVGYAYGLPSNLWNANALYEHTGLIDPSQAQAGDLVYFQGTDPTNGQYVTHVGIYTGNGHMINAQDGGVMDADLNSPYWQQHLVGFGRLPQAAQGGTPGVS